MVGIAAFFLFLLERVYAVAHARSRLSEAAVDALRATDDASGVILDVARGYIEPMADVKSTSRQVPF